MVESKASRVMSASFSNFIFILLGLACVAPVLLLISISFSDNGLIIRDGYSFWPKGFNLEAYAYVLKDPTSILNAYKVTGFVTVAGSIAGLILTTFIAYPLSRTEYKFTKWISFAVFFTMLFSGGLVPTYILMTKYLNLNDNILVLILPYLITPWYVMLMKSFFMGIPNEIIEAAVIDGAGEFRILFRIVMPLSKPALASIGLFIILKYYNDWWLSMLYINDSSKVSLQYFLYRVLASIEEAQKNLSIFEAGTVFPQESARMAMAVMVVVPVIIVFPFLQKYFVRGITIGSVKG
jgi:putative aldouronate transport system permease protein